MSAYLGTFPFSEYAQRIAAIPHEDRAALKLRVNPADTGALRAARHADGSPVHYSPGMPAPVPGVRTVGVSSVRRGTFEIVPNTNGGLL